MAFYIVRFDGDDYINEELCQRVHKKGDHSFIKFAMTGGIVGRAVLDQVMYLITPEERGEIEKRFSVQVQDFDAQYRRIHTLVQDEPVSSKEASPDSQVLVLKASDEMRFITHRFVTFIPFVKFQPGKGNRYGFLDRLPVARICKYWYIALNAVNIDAEKPLIVTVG
jgi:hypothetical protein